MNDQSSVPLARGRTQKDTPSGFCNLLQPGSYIHSVSDHITIVFDDNIAEIDPNAQTDSLADAFGDTT